MRMMMTVTKVITLLNDVCLIFNYKPIIIPLFNLSCLSHEYITSIVQNNPCFDQTIVLALRGRHALQFTL
jgi:hypothetical protein